MALEYHTVNFTNDASGISQKNAYAAQMAAEGWHITTEAIETGHVKLAEAGCLAFCCGPLAAFLAGRTPGIIVTTFAREYVQCTQCGMHLPPQAVFCRNCGQSLTATPPASGERVCPTCGSHVRVTATFCPNCGTNLPPALREKQGDAGES